MQLAEFDFPFDPTLVADHPVKPRDVARLLAVPRQSGSLAHHQVRDLLDLLAPGDVVVVNNTKVVPARLWGTKISTGGKVEVLVVKSQGEGLWDVLIRGTINPGQFIQLDPHTQAQVVERTAERTRIRVDKNLSMEELLHQKGEMPLPPYIKRKPIPEDRVDYQTVYAEVEGAVAAPTAGLHFSLDLLNVLQSKDIKVVSVTLHVGPGTFRPVVTDNIYDHHMDPEWFQIGPQAAEVMNQAKDTGNRVIAVGTTVMRTLESAVASNGRVVSQSGETKLFITPGFPFRVVDMLMTNFHFPRTTLLMLVSAFAGMDQARKAYAEAVRERYRMYSYGDAMLIY